MRVAVYHNLPSGGAKRAMVETLNQIRIAGNTVDVFAPTSADETFLPSHEVADQVRQWPTRASSGFQGRTRIQRLVSVVGVAASRRSLSKANRLIARAIDDASYDVVFVHHCRSTQAPSILTELQTPSAYYCQEPLRAAYEHELRPGAFLDRAHLFMPRVGLRAVDQRHVAAAGLVLANSLYSRESLGRAYGIDSRVVYLGVNPAIFHPGQRHRANTVLSVGAFHPVKGHRTVVDALGQIPASRRPSLVVIGDRLIGTEPALLRSLAAQRQVNLELLVGVSDAELVNRYQTAKLLICAQHLEPFGLVALEAAACGTPVVAVREAGLRESVMENDTGVFAPDRDPVTISRLIDETLSDTVGLRRLSGRAVEAVRTTWTWERTARRLLVHLSSIVQPSANQTDLKRLSLP